MSFNNYRNNPYKSCSDSYTQDRGYGCKKDCSSNYRSQCTCQQCCTQGPRGPRGPKGEATVIKGSYPTLADLIREHPRGEEGGAYLVGGELYVWNPDSRAWESVGNLQGPTGPAGDASMIKGAFDTLADLIAAHPTGEVGDAYLVGNELYIWNPDTQTWENVGNIQGPTGPTGPAGDATLIKGAFDSLADLIAAHSTGEVGDAYLVGNELYIWNPDTQAWESVGNIQGPTGPTGPTGPAGDATLIKGSFDSLADLIAAHPTGEIGDAYLVGNELYIWNPDAQAWESAGRVPTGVGTLIKGSYATVADLIAAHPTGEVTDGYLVDGELYVWDAVLNEWKAVGNLRGPAAKSAAIIPFTTAEAAPYTSGATGMRDYLRMIGQHGTAVVLAPVDPVTLPTAAILGNEQLTFSMPDDGQITAFSVFVSVALVDLLQSGLLTVQLYASSIPDNTFYPLAGTRVDITIPPGVAVGTTYHVNLRDLEVPLTVGTRVMIISYLASSGGLSITEDLHISGGIKIES